MSALVLTPWLHQSAAIELGGQAWRKRLLPVGEINYQGRKLVFSRDYLEEIAAAFRKGAYDQVPFQLADAKNSHTNDPERFRGEVTDMTVEPDGLWVTVRTTEAGSKVLQMNPRLGVSARIVEDYPRADGVFFPAAIQHVLGTLDPRIPELGSWLPSAELANGGPVTLVDLSACEYAGEPPYSPDPDADALSQATDEDWALLEEVLAEYDAEQELGLANEDGTGYGATGLADLTGAIELAAAAEAARIAEDALPRARGTEDRLAQCYDRIARGTFTPGREAVALGLAGGPGGLALAGWPAALDSEPNCGPSDEFGYCMEAYHSADCGSLADPELSAALAEMGALGTLATAPWSGSDGRFWLNQAALPMDRTQVLEAATGQKLTPVHDPFGTDGRELIAAERQVRFGDPDDPEDRSADMPGGTLAAARGYAERLGLASPDPARERERYAAYADEMHARTALRTFGRRHADAGESTRERAERMSADVYPVSYGDGPVAGSQPVYAAGML